MRLRHAFGLTLAAATAVLGLPGPASAGPTAEAGTTIHVNNSGDRACSDRGPGTFAQPYCTISAAAAVVEPGQTVRIWPGRNYRESVRITRSGTPDRPITFLGVPDGNPADRDHPTVEAATSGYTPVALTGVHDVVLDGLRFNGTLALTDVTRVGVDRSVFSAVGPGPAVTVGGTGDGVTVSRNFFDGTTGGIDVRPGSRNVLVTADDFRQVRGVGLNATDTADLAVTNNTFAFTCPTGVAVNGDSPRAVVKNNITTSAGVFLEPTCRTPAFSVSAEAAATAVLDYNTVRPAPGGSSYAWAGSTYGTPAEFAAATGQGGHDLDLALRFGGNYYDRLDNTDPASTGAVDSGDPTAPGVGTDLRGQSYIDHPGVAGADGSTRDRGAHELTGLDLSTVDLLGVSGGDGDGTPLTVRATVRFGGVLFPSWPNTYTVDFGDGSEPVTSATDTLVHTYPAVGSYDVRAVAADQRGGRAPSRAVRLTLADPAAVGADLTATNAGWPYDYRFRVTVPAPWNTDLDTIDFGDGTTPGGLFGGDTAHSYRDPGTYTVSYTTKDKDGRTLVIGKRIRVDIDPARAVLQPGERVQLLARTPTALLNSGAHYGYGAWAPFTPAGSTATARPFTEQDITASALATTGDQEAHNLVAANGRVHIADRLIQPGHWEKVGWWVADGRWSAWGEVTSPGAAGPLPGAPRQLAAVAMGRKLQVLALVDGHVQQATADYERGTWSPWSDVTAASGLPPATRITAAAVGNTLHIVALGADGHVRDAAGDYDRGTWGSGDPTPVIGLPGAAVTDLSAATTGSTLHIVAVAGGRLHQADADYAAGRWSGWADLTAATDGDSTADRVAAVTIGNKLHLYTLGGGVLRDATGDYDLGTWSRWGDVTATAGAPALTELAVTAS
ncbi:PKD domain-containing protein [Kitasatospora purpeofusca]|uniref:PKD domain-containing protein n=1 Tax=Kitasatospora purpeofusca TaxID=67352 RepID=UPI003255A30E